ncbi:hypothetical protein V8E54_013203 [Elaphomyces granulatus]
MGMNVDERFQAVTPGFEMPDFTCAKVAAHPPTNFLHLPEDVRIRIYQYSSLIRSCPIDVLEEKDTGALCGSRRNMAHLLQPCSHPKIPLNIFQVSRAVFEDASSALYSRNKFRLTLKGVGDFENFQQITKPYLHLIKSLHVDLRACDDGILRLEGWTENLFHDVTLRIWNMFCNAVPETIPGLEDFSLECRIMDADTAKRVLSPMESFPLLRRCGFCFDPLADRETLGIARETAYTRTSLTRGNQSTPFRFLDLPVELQFMVMENLLTFQWDPFVPPLPGIPRRLSAGQIVLRKHIRQELCEPVCCGSCSTSSSACFCSIRETVFSTHCRCFISPLPYFLVCREMYTVAHSIFYSKNRFCLLGDDPVPMMKVVQTLSKDSLSMIRHLTFASWTYHYDVRSNLLLNFAGRFAWSFLLYFLKERLHLELVSVNFIDLGCYATEETILDWRKYLRHVIESFGFLRGVRSFQVSLAYDRLYETVAERSVMGPRYRPTPMKNLPFVGLKASLPFAKVPL